MTEDSQHVIDALKAELAAKQAEIDELKASKDIYCRCGVKKGVTNHWWMVLYGGPASGLHIMAIDEYTPNERGVYYDEFPCCGAECVQKLVSHFLHGTIGSEA